MANAGAGRGDAVEIGVVGPNHVAERGQRTKQPKVVEMPDRALAPAPLRIGLLVSGFEKMQMHRHAVAG